MINLAQLQALLRQYREKRNRISSWLNLEPKLIQRLEDYRAMQEEAGHDSLDYADFEAYLDAKGELASLYKCVQRGGAEALIFDVWKEQSYADTCIHPEALYQKLVEYDRRKGPMRRLQDRREVRILNEFFIAQLQQDPNQVWLRYGDFCRYAQQQQASGLISTVYLSKNSLSAQVFSFWRQQPIVHQAEPELTLPFTRPKNVALLLLSWLDDQSLGRVAQTSRGMNQLVNTNLLWHPRLIDAGMSPDLVTVALQAKTVSLKKLYARYSKLSFAWKYKITDLWQLECLSGSYKALDHVQHPHLRDIVDAQPLHYLFLSANVLLCRIAVKRGAKLKAKDHYGRSALHYVFFTGNPDMAQFAIDVGLDVNATCNKSRTALHYAFWSGNLNMAQFAIDAGLDVQATDNKGTTTLHYAFGSANPNMAQFAIDIGLELQATNNNGVTALHYAFLGGNPNMAQFAIDAGLDVQATDNKGTTALHYAFASANPNVAQFAIDIGLELQATDNYGATALHYAFTGGHPNMAKFAIYAGLNLHATDSFGKTALHHAFSEGFPNTVEFAIDAGLDINARTNTGNNALYFAKLSDSPKIMEETYHKLRAQAAKIFTSFMRS